VCSSSSFDFKRPSSHQKKSILRATFYNLLKLETITREDGLPKHSFEQTKLTFYIKVSIGVFVPHVFAQAEISKSLHHAAYIRKYFDQSDLSGLPLSLFLSLFNLLTHSLLVPLPSSLRSSLLSFLPPFLPSSLKAMK
jgi:hypothetical protein